MPISVFVIVYFFKMKEGNMESVPSDYLDPDFRELCEEIISGQIANKKPKVLENSQLLRKCVANYYGDNTIVK